MQRSSPVNGAMRRYFLAALLVGLVFAVRWALDPLIGDRSPLILFTLAAVAAAAWLGTGPGAAALVLGAVVGVLAFIEPLGSLRLDRIDEVMNVAAYLATGVGVLAITNRLAAAHTREAEGAVVLRARKAELRASGELLRSVIDGALDPIFVKDLTGAFVLANARTAALFGVPVEAIIGKRDADFLPAEVAAAVTRVDRDVMESSEPRVVEELIPGGGDLRVFLSAKTPWRDATGRVIGLIGVARDITERKAAEAELAEREARLRYTVELSPIVPWTADPEGHINSFSDRWIEWTGRERADLLGKGWLEVPHPDDRPMMVEAWSRSIASGEPYDVVHRIRMKDGGYRWVYSRAYPHVEEGQIVQWYGTTEDVDRLKRTEDEVRRLNVGLEHLVEERTAELAEVNEELNAFTYTVSHDLRAPLRAMEGFARILLEDYASAFDDEGRRYASRIVLAAERMEALIDDLLTYSRLTRTELTLRPVRLADLVGGCTDEVRIAAPNASIDWQLPVDLPPILAEPSVLRQIVCNLLTNAAKFQPASQVAEIAVTAELRGDKVRVIVADNGIGIAPEHLDQVFRVFERLHGQETYPGTGIGLAIVRKGVERMNGRCGVESELGKGSAFWIELPQAGAECAQ